MGGRQTVAGIEGALRRALVAYYEHQQAEDDMAAAGAQIAFSIDSILAEPVCGPPRESLIRDKGPRPPVELEKSTPPDDYGYRDYRP